MNPVLGREVRERMRTGRSFAAVTAFLLFLLLTVYLVYQGNSVVDVWNYNLARQTTLGRQLYEWVLLVMLLLILFFVPGITAGAIAGERERQTLLPLQVTLLRPHNILIGKILAAIAFLGLLIVASMPVLIVAYLLGGIGVFDTLKGLLVLLFVSLLVSAMVVAVSTFAKRVQSATLMSYAFVALLCIAGPLTYLTGSVVDAAKGSDQPNAPAMLLTLNPLALVADAVGSDTDSAGDAPFSVLRRGLVEAKAQSGSSWLSWFPDDDFVAEFGLESTGFPAWGLSTIFMASLAALMFWMATRRLRAPAETER